MDVSEQIFPKAFIDRVQYIINILNQFFSSEIYEIQFLKSQNIYLFKLIMTIYITHYYHGMTLLYEI
jgi:hypothetical protein